MAASSEFEIKKELRDGDAMMMELKEALGMEN
jgi:hypothetical protein